MQQREATGGAGRGREGCGRGSEEQALELVIYHDFPSIRLDFLR